MIDIHNCDYHPTDEEIQIMLKCLKPGSKLPLLNDFRHPVISMNSL